MKHPSIRDLEVVTQFSPNAPAPHVQALIETRGPEVTRAALDAWERRVRGDRVIDIAHDAGLSIETCRTLMREAYAAVSEDLKEATAQNRELDLQRIDGLIRTWYPQAIQGDLDSANVVLKCLNQRAKLTGTEPGLTDPSRTQQPANVLVWIQQQLPAINKIVDSLPIE